jgi:hypothetical protein
MLTKGLEWVNCLPSCNINLKISSPFIVKVKSVEGPHISTTFSFPYTLKNSMVSHELMDMNIAMCKQSNIAHLISASFIFSTNPNRVPKPKI